MGAMCSMWEWTREGVDKGRGQCVEGGCQGPKETRVGTLVGLEVFFGSALVVGGGGGCMQQCAALMSGVWGVGGPARQPFCGAGCGERQGARAPLALRRETTKHLAPAG